MNKLARNLLTLMLVGSVLMVYGCEDDEGDGITRIEPTGWRDLTVTLQNMDTHIGQLIAFRVVSKYDEITTVWDELRCVARIDSLDQTTFTFEMPLSVPVGVHRLDFWCDDVANGWVDQYDPDDPEEPYDRSYRMLLPETGDITVTFDHPSAGVDTIGHYADPVWVIDVNQPTWVTPHVPPVHFWMNFTEMDTAVGHLLEIQVVDPDNDRTVGYFRKSSVTEDSFRVVLPSIGYLNDDGTGHEFQIDLYVDMDDSGGFNTGDFAWSFTEATGTFNDTLGAGLVVPVADSLKVDFSFNTNFASGFIWP